MVQVLPISFQNVRDKAEAFSTTPFPRSLLHGRSQPAARSDVKVWPNVRATPLAPQGCSVRPACLGTPLSSYSPWDVAGS